ncbi:protealysin inhibitor emfourin [Streptomyces sp. NBC_01497]|uniref:protealysin inhibitor emfourin n=1 Tax=Streptomyces sp. NBC_01497 TaxID=2903885 RepID=UPI002E354BE5|nr:protealysin inhibitor emfourin [Streptomyces sp. NBC_01497]
MRIAVRRTGGLAGIERHAEVDTSTRPDAQEWDALARQVVDEGGAAPPAGVPDGFRYEVTVDGRTVHLADPGLTDQQRELVTGVLKEGA